jgi:hypothetical protein
MNGTIEIRFFMFLSVLYKERNWSNPLTLKIDGRLSGIELLAILDIDREKVEALLVNGMGASPENALIQPGDRVAVLPPGTPGPYRVLLGIRKSC